MDSINGYKEKSSVSSHSNWPGHGYPGHGQSFCLIDLFDRQRTCPTRLYLSSCPLLASFPMSYHRVLPPLPAHSVATKGAAEQDTLLRHKIMTTESSSVIVDRTKSLTLEKSSSPVPEKEPASSGEESVEDSLDSPNTQTQPSSQITSNRREQRLEKPLRPITKPSPVSWQGEPPSQICLCQPDPKVPRPRNGMLRRHASFLIVKYKAKTRS